MCTGSMIIPVAPMTTEKYEATYQCAGFTGNTSFGSVPNEPPMISIVRIGNTTTKNRVIGSRVTSLSSLTSSRRVTEGTRRPAATGCRLEDEVGAGAVRVVMMRLRSGTG